MHTKENLNINPISYPINCLHYFPFVDVCICDEDQFAQQISNTLCVDEISKISYSYSNSKYDMRHRK